jgi:signal-transduction protein with cAMP-binding, CBS, and nucleotidyltransferase domain
MELMTAGKFQHLPVVEEGRLIGIVSIGDVVKHRVQAIESDSATLRDYTRSGRVKRASRRGNDRR